MKNILLTIFLGALLLLAIALTGGAFGPSDLELRKRVNESYLYR